MRNIVTIILICFLSFPAFGQEIENSHKDKTYKNIYLELLGASNMIGVSYDTRIKPGSAIVPEYPIFMGRTTIPMKDMFFPCHWSLIAF